MKVAKSWGQVTLKQYIEIVEVSAIDMDDLDKHVKILSILSNCDEETILSVPLIDIRKYIRDTSFIYTPYKSNGVRSSIRIKGRRFSIEHDVRTLKGGEYIDYKELTKERDQITSNLPQILAIFFKPINILGLKKRKCYKDGMQTLESRTQTAELLAEHLTMDVVFELSAFFLNSWQSLTEATRDYLKLELKRKTAKLKKELTKAGLENIGRGI